MTTDSIFGHQQIQSQLYNAIETGRIAGAYLFVGMEGLGKEKAGKHPDGYGETGEKRQRGSKLKDKKKDRSMHYA